MFSKNIILQFMKLKSFVTQFQGKVKALVSSNSEIKKRVFAPFKKWPENLLAVDKLKWTMRVKETEINKIKLHQSIDTHLKANSEETQWMVHLKVMDYQEAMVLLLQWVRLLNMEVMDKDLHQEWWEDIQATTIISTVVLKFQEELENMDKDHLVIMEWVEEVMVEWEAWVEWQWKVGTIPICNNINNSVDLNTLANMEPHH
jgi:hypothetical protein